ncbi:hypothetical protein ACFU51_09090 [Streptomyces sp. NPDC057430]|uniref:hypothetical protein n=1 Tax=unclassified Streptomyces TaxID=2593676 RepID=UPI0036AD81EB
MRGPPPVRELWRTRTVRVEHDLIAQLSMGLRQVRLGVVVRAVGATSGGQSVPVRRYATRHPRVLEHA